MAVGAAAGVGPDAVSAAAGAAGRADLGHVRLCRLTSGGVTGRSEERWPLFMSSACVSRQTRSQPTVRRPR